MTIHEELAQARAAINNYVARVAWLEGQLATVDKLCDPQWGLAFMEARLVGRLLRAKGEVVSHEAIYFALWGESPPNDPKMGVQTFVSRARAKLTPHGLMIKSWRPIGYSIPVSRQ